MHGDICLEGDKSDRSFSDAVGMLVSWWSAFERILVAGHAVEEFSRLIVGLSVNPDESRVWWVGGRVGD